MSTYRFTCLSPVLAGSGNHLAPIDYMVWRDQVNVLDQMRIFKLLSRGPRLDSYLAQIRRAEKLDFASWGGYAQNFASRRIALDGPELSALFDRAHPQDLFIPTFATTLDGQIYMPASVLKGPLRTAWMVSKATPELVEAGVNHQATRSAARGLEASLAPGGGGRRTRGLMLSDSAGSKGAARIFLTRTSTLVQRGKGLELGWKMSPRGSMDARRVNDSTPAFAEMAPAGTVFEGSWQWLGKSAGGRTPAGLEKLAEAANLSAERLIAYQRAYAEAAGLDAVIASLDKLSAALREAKGQPGSCLVCLGWGAGYLAKSVLLGLTAEQARDVLRKSPVYGRQIATGLPFPKTRRFVFSAGKAAALPGWGRLDFAS